MALRLGAAEESNNNPATVLTGSLATGARVGMTVTGVNFAGNQSGNVGLSFEGIYGSLTVSANGSYTYTLNNLDNDTNLLSSGESALERFVVTYGLGGITQTLDIEIEVRGIDEPGQEKIRYDTGVFITQETTIDENTYVEFFSSEGFVEGLDTTGVVDPHWNFSNFGSIKLQSDGTLLGAVAAAPTPPLGRLLNFGRIVAESNPTISGDISAVGDFGSNFGVISAFHTAPFDSERSAGRALSGGAIDYNEGLIEAVSNFDAYGVWAFNGGPLVNKGLIYVEGGAGYDSGTLQYSDPLGIIGYRAGGTGNIVNEGTVRVVSHNPEIASVGFSFFPNGTNIYNAQWFDNSGTIVADRAVIALDGFQVTTYLTNSGHIEGTLELDRGVNQITNTETGFWGGDWTLAYSPDLVRNAGQIDGHVNLRDGADFYIGVGLGAVSGNILAGPGNDVLIGGNGVDRFFGDEGNDWLQGGGGADQLSGGVGQDVFAYLAVSDSIASNRDVITDFQTGIDKIDISAIGASGFSLIASGENTILRVTTADGTLEVLVQGAASTGDVINFVKGSSLIGTSGSDLLVATALGSSLNGSAGNDALVGTSGNDILDGGSGADTMAGGAGNDVYFRDNLDDLIVEEEDGGFDELRTNVGSILPTYVEKGVLLGSDNLVLRGNELDNILIGNDGANELQGGGGHDIIFGGLGADKILLNGGNDTVVYSAIAESTQSAPDQLVLFEFGQDVVDLTSLTVTQFTIGNYRSMMVPVGASLNVIQITDVIVTTDSGDLFLQIEGRPGLSDFMWLKPTGLVGNLLGMATDDLLRGSVDIDIIEGLDGADELWGLGGNDTLRGGNGNDTVIGGAGADALDGGEGIDTVSYEGSAQGVFVRLQGYGDLSNTQYTFGGDAAGDTLTGFENVIGSSFNDDLIGSNGANFIQGGAGNDVIRGRAGADALDGGAGIDTVSYEGSAQGVFVRLQGYGDLSNTQYAFGGDAAGDTLTGFENVIGSSNADDIIGSEGVNRIDGGAGNDVIRGRGGSDIFVFKANSGQDTITDWQDGIDVIDVSSLGTNWTTISEGLSQVGNDAIIDLGGGNTITLKNVALGAIDQGDFQFGAQISTATARSTQQFASSSIMVAAVSGHYSLSASGDGGATSDNDLSTGSHSLSAFSYAMGGYGELAGMAEPILSPNMHFSLERLEGFEASRETVANNRWMASGEGRDAVLPDLEPAADPSRDIMAGSADPGLFDSAHGQEAENPALSSGLELLASMVGGATRAEALHSLGQSAVGIQNSPRGAVEALSVVDNWQDVMNVVEIVDVAAFLDGTSLNGVLNLDQATHIAFGSDVLSGMLSGSATGSLSPVNILDQIGPLMASES